MTTKSKLVFALVLLAPSGCTRPVTREPSTSPTQKAEKAQLYHCPMHPQVTSQQPDRCPICGMDLVPIAHTHPDNESIGTGPTDPQTIPPTHSPVNISERQQQLIGIKTSPAQKRKLFKTVKAPGRVAFDPDLYIAQGEYLEALRQWTRVKDSPLQDVKRSTQEMIRSSRIRLRVLGLSDDQIDQLAAKGTLSEGLLMAGAGQENWVYAEIFESDLSWIKAGLSVAITASSFKGTLAGEVVSVDRLINAETRTARARIRLKDSHLSLRPELYVQTSIFVPLGEHLAVSLEALLDTGREILVFVRQGPGIFEPRRVHLAFEADEYAAIAQGLQEGEEVVIGGNFMLDSESRLKSVLGIGQQHQETQP